MFEYNNNTRKKTHRLILLNRLLNREYLAHVLAYENLSDGDLITLPRANSKFIEKVIVHKIETDCDGLIGYILEIQDFDYIPRVEILWRGTHNLASLHMDLETGGPGAISYNNARLKVITKINKVIDHLYKKTGERIIVGVSGHSLGGALAQRCFTDLLGVKVRNNHNAISSDKILKLELAVFNSAGVDEETYKKANRYSEYFNETGSKQKSRAFSITADYCLNDGDGIQQVGRKNILVGSPWVNVNLFKFNQSGSFFKKIIFGVISGGLFDVVCRQIFPFKAVSNSKSDSTDKNNFTELNKFESKSIINAKSSISRVFAGSLLMLSGYKLAKTVAAHTEKHSYLLEKYNLALKNQDVKIFSNKLLDHNIDIVGSSEIERELLGEKSWIINNRGFDLISSGLHFLTRPILRNLNIVKKEVNANIKNCNYSKFAQASL